MVIFQQNQAHETFTPLTRSALEWMFLMGFVIVSRFSNGDIDQHIAMCCSTEDIGNDDTEFW